MKELTKVCNNCGGSGLTGGTEAGPGGEPIPSDDTCVKCSGSGVTILGFLSDDLITLLSDMNDKINDISEKVNE